MTILITGTGGQVGRALLATIPAGQTAIAVNRQIVDLAQTAQIRPSLLPFQPTLIINAAAYTAVDQAETDPETAWAVNATAVGELAKLARETNARLVQISTDFVFDGSATKPIQPDAQPMPMSVYGKSKLAGEQATGADDLIIRTSWVHAAVGSNFVNTMLRLMVEREELRVVDDQVGSPTWATHLAEAIWALIGADAAGVHHVTGQGAISWCEFARAIREEAVSRGMIPQTAAAITAIGSADYPTLAARPAYSVLDCSSSNELIGHPLPDWHVGLAAMLDERAALDLTKKELSHG